MIDTVFSFLDGLMGFLPLLARVICWAVAAGVGTMGLYWLMSPQQKLAQLQADAARARKELNAYDGDEFSVVWNLATRSLGLALKQVAFVLGPTLVAAIPLIALLSWISGAYAVDPTVQPSNELFHFGPEWVRSWHATFFLILTVCALGMKLKFNIK